ncbi:MAG: hypothetical protein LBT50_08470, partial [Prevotellaceae bacterium]|nr:hypothetical protein [Prevotellaceae bacterium]
MQFHVCDLDQTFKG